MENATRNNSPAAPMPAEVSRQGDDPAADSLASALRISFRLLKVILVAIVVAFFLTGVRWVEPGEAAVVYRFGKIVKTVQDGPCFAWPFPVGRIDVVSLQTQDVQIDDFWMGETAEDKTKPISERRPQGGPRGGLQPGWDGALFTGDGSLIHVRLQCYYTIDANASLGIEHDPLVKYCLAVQDPDIAGQAATKEFLRSVVCREAIRLAGVRSAESIRRNQDEFAGAVQKAAQALLTEHETGLEISTITLEFSWPLRVRRDFEAATNAGQEAEKAINAALADAEEMLITVAGPNYSILVSKPSRMVGGDDDEGVGLIEQYAFALEADDTATAEALLAQIEAALVSDITGKVRPMIGEAIADVNTSLDALDGRLGRFKELLPEYQARPEFVVARLWADTRDAILSSATIEKYYVTGGAGKMVVKFDRDPGIARRIQRALMSKVEDAAADSDR
jgi:modulator of FtsH protease HflK